MKINVEGASKKINVQGAQGSAPKLGKLNKKIDDKALDNPQARNKHGNNACSDRPPKRKSEMLEKLKRKKEEQKQKELQNSPNSEDASEMKPKL